MPRRTHLLMLITALALASCGAINARDGVLAGASYCQDFNGYFHFKAHVPPWKYNKEYKCTNVQNRQCVGTWLATGRYVFVVSAVLVPAVTELLKKWQAAAQIKQAVAFLVACAVAAGGLLLDGKLTWETLVPNLGVVFTTGTLVYRMFFKEGVPAMMKKLTGLTILVMLAVLVAGCQTKPEEVPSGLYP